MDLTEEQINRLHLTSLEILEKIGIRISHEGARKLLENNECFVEETNIVHIPKWLVDESIRSAPSQIIIYNREGKETMRLEGNNNYYGLGTDLLRTIDLKTIDINRFAGFIDYISILPNRDELRYLMIIMAKSVKDKDMMKYCRLCTDVKQALHKNRFSAQKLGCLHINSILHINSK